MKGMTISNITKACGGDFFGSDAVSDREVSNITTDSRLVSDGCLFCALKGERSDGHDFIAAAARDGAICALVERTPDVPVPGANYILVPSTAAAIQAIAAFYRSMFSIPFIGVIGSVGKTTMKEMLAAVLSERYNVLKTEGNFNNELGVPLTLFRLVDSYKAAVVEMGISDFGEMRRLTRMVRPDMAVFTAVGDSHLRQLGSLQGVLRAKSEIVEGMSPSSVMFINGDDEILAAADFGIKTVRFGLGDGCSPRAVSIKGRGTDGTVCDIIEGENRFSITIPFFGIHMVYAALGAWSVARSMGLSADEITSGIKKYSAAGGRSGVVRGSFCTVIDDCYNANPTSTISALRSLGALPGRRVAILGDMLELGDEEKLLHRSVGIAAEDQGIELVLTFGSLSGYISGGKSEAGSTLFLHYNDKAELIKALPKHITKNDTVLVKASHSMRFGEIVEALRSLQSRSPAE